jgi:hypothetical protein
LGFSDVIVAPKRRRPPQRPGRAGVYVVFGQGETTSNEIRILNGAEKFNKVVSATTRQSTPNKAQFVLPLVLRDPGVVTHLIYLSSPLARVNIFV